MKAVASVVSAAAIAIIASIAGARAQQMRDTTVTSPLSPTGTAVIAGRVIVDDAQAVPVPVRHATVTIAGGDLRGSRDVMTDDQGRFEFMGLTAGSYRLSAAKAAWVTSYYGGRHPGVSPLSEAPLIINDGERAANIEMRLLHGSAITGVVRDAAGTPARVRIELLQFRMSGGVRSVQWAPGMDMQQTDDRGVYRMFGLAPGEYLIKAKVDSTTDDVLHLMTSDTLQAAMHALAGGAVPSVTPADTGRAVAFSDVFYPGTVDANAATLIKLGANEEKTGIDFALQLAPAATISGTVVGMDGRPFANAMVGLESPVQGGILSLNVTTGRDGSFTTASVPPGQYRLTARANDPGALAAAGRIVVGGLGPMSAASLWGQQDIVVDGTDQSGLALTLQPGMSVSGRVTAPAGVDLTKCTLLLPRMMDGGGFGGRSGVDADGSFTFSGVPPGLYELSLAQGMPGTDPKVSSARLGDSDVVDTPFEVRPSTNVSNIAVKLTDKLGEIVGTLRDPGGAPAPHYVIAMFSADRAYWTSKNRRMPALTETLRDGTFRIGDLPAGDYFLVMAADIDPDSLQDPKTLEQLASQAQRITIGEGEKKVQNFRISGG